jgi:hypothetical protein
VLIFPPIIDGIVHRLDFFLHVITLYIPLRFLYGVCIHMKWYIYTYSGIEISQQVPHVIYKTTRGFIATTKLTSNDIKMYWLAKCESDCKWLNWGCVKPRKRRIQRNDSISNHWKKFLANNMKIRSDSMLKIETIDSKIYEMQVVETRIESRKGP